MRRRIRDLYQDGIRAVGGAMFKAANEAIPFYEDGDEIPCVASAAVTGKRLVQVSAVRQSGPGLSQTSEGSRYVVSLPANAGANGGAGKAVVGVAAWDAPINGPVTVITDKIVPVTCSANITFGQEVEVDATGQVIPLAAGKAVGMAMNSTTSGNDAEILLYH